MRRHIYYTLQSLLHKQGSNAIKIVSLALGLLMSVFLFARIDRKSTRLNSSH